MPDDLLEAWQRQRSLGLSVPDFAAAPRDELTYRLRQQALLSEFGLFALRSETVEEVVQESTEAAAQGLEVEFCKFLEYRPQEDDLLVVAGIGWKEGTVGRATLRADLGSPSGYAYKMNLPTLSNDLEDDTRFRTPDLLREHGVRCALNVPVDGEGRPHGILEVDSRNFACFSEADIAFLQGIASMLSVVIARHSKSQELATALERERLWAEEMRHRVKNIFALVTAMASTSQREGEQLGDPSRAMEVFNKRLAALSRASDAGLPSMTLGDRDYQGHFDPVAATRLVLEPYAGRTAIGGAVSVQPGSELATVALVIHELATNAVKYGALSTETGSVTVEWSEDEGRLSFLWIERGGPEVAQEPAHEGFGRKLIGRLLRPSGGGIETEWRADGLVARVTIRAED